MKKKKAKSTRAQAPLSRSLRVYQKASIVFVVLSFLLLLAVLYLSVSRAIITIEPVAAVESATVSVVIRPEPQNEGEVSGYVVQKSVQKAKTFTVPEDGAQAVEAKARGVVTLVNETGAAQPLIATTRVLSEDGILFRLDSAVNVPARGEVQAAVTADQPGEAGEIGPSRFTIPGLNATLQQSIYARSTDSMVGGIQYIRALTQEDLDNAAKSLEAEMLEEVKTEFRDGLPAAFDGDAFLSEITSRTTDAQVGAEVGTFNIALTATFTGIFYNRETITHYVENKLYNQLAAGKELLTVNEDGLVAKVTSANVGEESATLDLTLEGTVIIAITNDALDKDRMIGKSAKEITTMLEASEEIESVHVTFTPFWLKHVPSLKDHIDIKIKKPRNGS